MKKKVEISEPERLANFMHSFGQNHGEDFKALVLHLIQQSNIGQCAQSNAITKK